VKLTRSQAIRQILDIAPSTCNEVSALLGLTWRSTRRGLDVLLAHGHVEVAGVIDAQGMPRLYRLTPRGRAVLKAREKEHRMVGWFGGLTLRPQDVLRRRG